MFKNDRSVRRNSITLHANFMMSLSFHVSSWCRTSTKLKMSEPVTFIMWINSKPSLFTYVIPFSHEQAQSEVVETKLVLKATRFKTFSYSDKKVEKICFWRLIYITVKDHKFWDKSHSPRLIRSFAVYMNKHWSLATHKVHNKDWSDWANAQVDLSLC